MPAELGRPGRGRSSWRDTDIFENDERFLDVNDNVIPIPQPYEDLTVLTNWISGPNFLGCYALRLPQPQRRVPGDAVPAGGEEDPPLTH